MGAAAFGTSALAGCSGTDGKTPAENEAESIAESAVDERAIESHEPRDDEDGFRVVVTVRNNGDRTTNLVEYGYELVLYDAEGTELARSGTGRETTNETKATPGETATIDVSALSTDYSPAIARYEVSLTCQGAFVDGVYCQS
ncbi:hypothetical protein A6E15_14815 [Natrinema saccharevitans]|uniref:DUF4352 domain-containing protein n=2 Tax=Natrinema saccharevitans TaxID=301967 RepID=A0A1S8AZS5_9EURY|nr:hypothetical protein A6E15_14815 [Natrinema saccharevitans]